MPIFYTRPFAKCFCEHCLWIRLKQMLLCPLECRHAQLATLHQLAMKGKVYVLGMGDRELVSWSSVIQSRMYLILLCFQKPVINCRLNAREGIKWKVNTGRENQWDLYHKLPNTRLILLNITEVIIKIFINKLWFQVSYFFHSFSFLC